MSFFNLELPEHLFTGAYGPRLTDRESQFRRRIRLLTWALWLIVS